MRTRGSVRFDPYYKVQWWDATSLAWRDIQLAHPTEAQARAAAPEGRTRVMEIAPGRRTPLAESDEV